MNLATRTTAIFATVLLSAALPALELNYRNSLTNSEVSLTLDTANRSYRVAEPSRDMVQTLVAENGDGLGFTYLMVQGGKDANRTVRDGKDLHVETAKTSKTLNFPASKAVLLQDVVFYQLRDLKLRAKQNLPMVYQDFEQSELSFEPLPARNITTPAGTFACRGVRMQLEGFSSLFVYIRWDFWYSGDDQALPVLAEEFQRDGKIKSTFQLTGVR